MTFKSVYNFRSNPTHRQTDIETDSKHRIIISSVGNKNIYILHKKTHMTCAGLLFCLPFLQHIILKHRTVHTDNSDRLTILFQFLNTDQ